VITPAVAIILTAALMAVIGAVVGGWWGDRKGGDYNLMPLFFAPFFALIGAMVGTIAGVVIFL
jgi:hypothetical protein